jgi:hypothetical protein
MQQNLENSNLKDLFENGYLIIDFDELAFLSKLSHFVDNGLSGKALSWHDRFTGSRQEWVKQVLSLSEEMWSSKLVRSHYQSNSTQLVEVLGPNVDMQSKAHLRISRPENIRLYSSWPNHINHDDLVWHKDIRSYEQIKESTFNGYLQRYHLFIDSSPSPGINKDLIHPSQGLELRRDYLSLLGCMNSFIFNADEPAEPTLQSMSALIAKTEGIKTLKNLNDIMKDCFHTLSATLFNDKLTGFSTLWNESQMLTQSWGTPGHYYVFHLSDTSSN